MKIREIYTLTRDFSLPPDSTIEYAKESCSFIREMAGEFLFAAGMGEEKISVAFQIDKGNGWEDFDPEKI